MLVLFSAPASPFGRKVKIAADVVGLMGRIDVVDVDTNDPDHPLRQKNPLGKIPTLVLENGDALYDSRVIVEYFDHLLGKARLIPNGADHFPVLRMQALADGLCDAAVTQIYEGRWRPKEHWAEKWLVLQAGKVERALKVAEAGLKPLSSDIHIGEIALACGLGYLDLRFEGRWRETHPKLAEWLTVFSERVPAFEKTRLKT